jgi:hypothetical protein
VVRHNHEAKLLNAGRPATGRVAKLRDGHAQMREAHAQIVRGAGQRRTSFSPRRLFLATFAQAGNPDRVIFTQNA